jgi:hypothetical protein
MIACWTVCLSIAGVVAVGAPARGQMSREETADRIGPILAVPPATGLLIFEVIPGSQAEKAGFRVGDVLTHYDGQPVANIEQLVRLAGAAIKENREHILVTAKRGVEDLEAEFDPAPLGVRLVAVNREGGRTLWRPETRYEPDGRPLAQLVAEGHRWELLMHGGEVLGWSHAFVAERGKRLILRAQSRLDSKHMNEKRDVVVTFSRNKYLSPRSIRLKSKETLVLDLHYDSGKLTGERVGVPVSAEAPADCVSSYLAGHVAAMMPLKPGACLRCSALEPASLVAAPFADICCVGEQPFEVAGKTVKTWHFEQTIFGKTVAQFWIDENRRIVQTLYSNGVKAIPSSEQEVTQYFPNATSEFDVIERLPELAPKAN